MQLDLRVARRVSFDLPVQRIRYFFAGLAGSMVAQQGFRDCSSLRSGEVVEPAVH